MATDVHKPKPTIDSTNPTSQVPLPPSRDHKYNNNQTIPITTNKDQAVTILPGFSAPDLDDFHNMTPEEQYNEKCYNYFDNIDDDNKVVEIPRHVRL